MCRYSANAIGLTAVLALVACLDPASPARSPGPAPSQPSPPSPASTNGTWILHIDGGQFAPHVQIVRIDSVSVNNTVQWKLRSFSSLDWAGAAVHDFDGVEAASEGGYEYNAWRLRFADGEGGMWQYTISGDSLSGRLLLMDSSGSAGAVYSVVGARLGAAFAAGLGAALGGTALSALWVDSTPRVLLRIDDAPITDRDFLQRVHDRGLVGELAVPTRLVGRQGRLTWSEIEGWRARGFGVAAHSRYHLHTRDDDLAFLAEVVGSL